MRKVKRNEVERVAETKPLVDLIKFDDKSSSSLIAHFFEENINTIPLDIDDAYDTYGINLTPDIYNIFINRYLHMVLSEVMPVLRFALSDIDNKFNTHLTTSIDTFTINQIVTKMIKDTYDYNIEYPDILPEIVIKMYSANIMTVISNMILTELNNEMTDEIYNSMEDILSALCATLATFSDGVETAYIIAFDELKTLYLPNMK